MTDTPAAPHTPSDDPRVDILAAQLCSTPGGWRAASDTGARIARDAARDLLARLDAAAPARDDALDRWLDTEIGEAASRGKRAQSQGWAVAYEQAIERASTLREVRDRLGATTNNEGGTDD